MGRRAAGNLFETLHQFFQVSHVAQAGQGEQTQVEGCAHGARVRRHALVAAHDLGGREAPLDAQRRVLATRAQHGVVAQVA